MWLTTKDAEATVVFSENPTKPGMAMFIKSVANRTSLAVAVSPASTATNVSLSEKSVGSMDGELVGSLPAVSAAATIEGQALWGLFAEAGPKTLLQYWFSAPRITKPHDWFYVDSVTTIRLSLTFRPVRR